MEFDTSTAKPKTKAKAKSAPAPPADDDDDEDGDSEPEQAQPKVKSMKKATGHFMGVMFKCFSSFGKLIDKFYNDPCRLRWRAA